MSIPHFIGEEAELINWSATSWLIRVQTGIPTEASCLLSSVVCTVRNNKLSELLRCYNNRH